MRCPNLALITIPTLTMLSSGCDAIDKHLNSRGLGSVVSTSDPRSHDYTGPKLDLYKLFEPDLAKHGWSNLIPISARLILEAEPEKAALWDQICSCEDFIWRIQTSATNQEKQGLFIKWAGQFEDELKKQQLYQPFIDSDSNQWRMRVMEEFDQRLRQEFNPSGFGEMA